MLTGPMERQVKPARVAESGTFATAIEDAASAARTKAARETEKEGIMGEKLPQIAASTQWRRGSTSSMPTVRPGLYEVWRKLEIKYRVNRRAKSLCGYEVPHQPIVLAAP